MLTLKVILSHILTRDGMPAILLQATKQHLGKVPKGNHSSIQPCCHGNQTNQASSQRLLCQVLLANSYRKYNSTKLTLRLLPYQREVKGTHPSKNQRNRYFFHSNILNQSSSSFLNKLKKKPLESFPFEIEKEKEFPCQCLPFLKSILSPPSGNTTREFLHLAESFIIISYQTRASDMFILQQLMYRKKSQHTPPSILKSSRIAGEAIGIHFIRGYFLQCGLMKL